MAHRPTTGGRSAAPRAAPGAGAVAESTRPASLRRRPRPFARTPRLRRRSTDGPSLPDRATPAPCRPEGATTSRRHPSARYWPPERVRIIPRSPAQGANTSNAPWRPGVVAPLLHARRAHAASGTTCCCTGTARLARRAHAASGRPRRHHACRSEVRRRWRAVSTERTIWRGSRSWSAVTVMTSQPSSCRSRRRRASISIWRRSPA